MPLPLPPFTRDGVLPEGDYELTVSELEQSTLAAAFIGDEESRIWRRTLATSAGIIIDQLRQAGITQIYVDGSFATSKPIPGDVDIYFECSMAQIATDDLLETLNRIDPRQCWTWDDEDRLPELVDGKRQLPMWWEYRVEAWPEFGQKSGQFHPITNESLTHAQLFRIMKYSGIPKGIIKIIDEKQKQQEATEAESLEEGHHDKDRE